ncbi:MAG: hypothetical protein NC548_64235, partial [Lachnospiraceae bacterium]|nr:hypothetical protein [Lachnospiraceae bacterium]
WGVPVRQFFPLGSPAHHRQSDSWLRSTPDNPTVILDKDTIFIYGLATALQKVAANPAARLERLLMTAWPSDGSYSFDHQDYPTFSLDP